MIATDTLFTQFPLHSGGTQALKAPYIINARGAFAARALSTFIFICRKSIGMVSAGVFKPTSYILINKVRRGSDSSVCISFDPFSPPRSLILEIPPSGLNIGRSVRSSLDFPERKREALATCYFPS